MKAIVNAETYDQVQNMMIKNLFLTSKGLQALNSEAEESPELNEFLYKNLKQIKDEQRQFEEAAFQGVK
jgi:hypothetical protein